MLKRYGQSPKLNIVCHHQMFVPNERSTERAETLWRILNHCLLPFCRFVTEINKSVKRYLPRLYVPAKRIFVWLLLNTVANRLDIAHHNRRFTPHERFTLTQLRTTRDVAFRNKCALVDSLFDLLNIISAPRRYVTYSVKLCRKLMQSTAAGDTCRLGWIPFTTVLV